MLIISIIYSFRFSCFHYLVPGLGTIQEKEVAEYQLDAVTSFLFGATLVQHFRKYLVSANVETLIPALSSWHEKKGLTKLDSPILISNSLYFCETAIQHICSSKLNDNFHQFFIHLFIFYLKGVNHSTFVV